MKWIFLTVFLIFTIPVAFADIHFEIVSIPLGSDDPECYETNTCFYPFELTVDLYDEVTWSNDGFVVHTVTSGTARDGPDGYFDSGLIGEDKIFTHQFEEYGYFPYFCMVHPWMHGTIIVEDGPIFPIEEEDPEEQEPDESKDKQIKRLNFMLKNANMEKLALELKVEKLEKELDYLENYLMELIKDIHDSLHDN